MGFWERFWRSNSCTSPSWREICGVREAWSLVKFPAHLGRPTPGATAQNKRVARFSSVPHKRRPHPTCSLPPPHPPTTGQAGPASLRWIRAWCPIPYLHQKLLQTPRDAQGTTAQQRGTCGTAAGTSGAGPAAWSTGGRARRSLHSGRGSCVGAGQEAQRQGECWVSRYSWSLPRLLGSQAPKNPPWTPQTGSSH